MTDGTQESKRIVEGFWAAMQTNDFKAAAEFLHENYILEWPQSGERIRGRANFAAINEKYPAHGRWEFVVHRILAAGDEAPGRACPPRAAVVEALHRTLGSVGVEGGGTWLIRYRHVGPDGPPRPREPSGASSPSPGRARARRRRRRRRAFPRRARRP